MEDNLHPPPARIHVGTPVGVQTGVSRFGLQARTAIREMLFSAEELDSSLGLSFSDADETEPESPDGSDLDELVTGNAENGDQPDTPMVNASVSGGGVAVSSAFDHAGQAGSMDNHVMSSKDALFPRVARHRVNVTALSQRYNLYFAAYRDHIHVYIPRQAPRILGKPVLILTPSASEAAGLVGGHIDRLYPHLINHLLVGNLDGQEILLSAHDDGDVVGYLVDEIVTYVKARQYSTASNPALLGASRRQDPNAHLKNPFFHENVGKSAWGLAVHTKSRIIGVSANTHEISVFAFCREPSNSQPIAIPAWSTSYGGHYTPSPLSENDWDVTREKDPNTRTRDWRLMISVDYDTQNMPSISFGDDEQGLAEFVSAVDVIGNSYLVDIWRHAGRTVTLYRPDAFQDSAWGALMLPQACFESVTTVREALAINPRWSDYSVSSGVRPRYTEVDVSATILAEAYGFPLFAERAGPRPIPSTFSEPHFHLMRPFNLTELHQRMGNLLQIKKSMSRASPETRLQASSHLSVKKVLPACPTEEESHTDSTRPACSLRPRRSFTLMCPSISQVFPVSDTPTLVVTVAGPEAKLQRREHQMTQARVTAEIFKTDDRFKAGVIDSVSFLYIGASMVQLINIDPANTNLVCHNLLTFAHSQIPDLDTQVAEQRLPADLQGPGRNMFIHIPELYLVIVGTFHGRVVLLSLTSCPSETWPESEHAKWQGPRDEASPRRAFRIAGVLPRLEEEAMKLRPRCCLLGIAASKIPDPGAKGPELERGDLRRSSQFRKETRWRLMLHYMDHTILMYEITKTKLGGFEVI